MLEGTHETKLLSMEITLDKSPGLVFKLYVDPTTIHFNSFEWVELELIKSEPVT